MSYLAILDLVGSDLLVAIGLEPVTFHISMGDKSLPALCRFLSQLLQPHGRIAEMVVEGITALVECFQVQLLSRLGRVGADADLDPSRAVFTTQPETGGVFIDIPPVIPTPTVGLREER